MLYIIAAIWTDPFDTMMVANNSINLQEIATNQGCDRSAAALTNGNGYIEATTSDHLSGSCMYTELA